jgi:hypothetical protein
MQKYAASTWCFFCSCNVGVYPDVEWRISTCLAERYLKCTLNIRQIRTNVLIKIILITFLNPQGKVNVWSFMCKTSFSLYWKHRINYVEVNNLLIHCMFNRLFTGITQLYSDGALFTLYYIWKQSYGRTNNRGIKEWPFTENKFFNIEWHSKSTGYWYWLSGK